MGNGNQTAAHQAASAATTPRKGLACVRLATAADEPELFKLLALQHRETGMPTPDAGAVRSCWSRAFSGNGGIIGVIDRGNGLEGMLVLLIVRYWFSLEWHLEEVTNFVHPQFRKGTTHAEDLVQFAKQCSDRLDIPLVIGVMTNKRVAAKVRLYQRLLGRPPVGAWFVYNAPQWEPPNAEFWRIALRRRRSLRQAEQEE